MKIPMEGQKIFIFVMKNRFSSAWATRKGTIKEYRVQSKEKREFSSASVAHCFVWGLIF